MRASPPRPTRSGAGSSATSTTARSSGSSRSRSSSEARSDGSAREADPELDQLLASTADELQVAVDELRELAHGIHPAILTAGRARGGARGARGARAAFR